MATGQSSPGELFKTFSAQDWMVVGGGAAVFIFSFFTFVGVSGTFAGVNISAGGFDAWHSYATLGLLLLLATSISWGLQATKKVTLPPLPAKFEVVAAGVAGLGTLLILIRGLTYSSSAPGISVGLRFGGIMVIIAGAVVTAGAAWTHYGSGTRSGS